MNLIWNKNISLFKKRFPQLAEFFSNEISRIEKAQDEFENEKTPEAITKLNERIAPFWKIEKAKDGNFFARENNILLHSSYAPLREAETLVEKSDFSECNGAFFFGFGLAYAVQIFAKKFPHRIIIVCEPNPQFFFASLWFCDWTYFFEAENCVALIASESHFALQIIEKVGIEKCAFFSNQAHRSHAENYFSEIDKLLERNKRKNEINSATLEKFGRRWLINGCKNAREYEKRDSVSMYSNAWKKPCVILGAGPSLEKIGNDLAKIKMRAILICVDTALRFCLQKNIEPDFVLIGDPQYYAWKHLARSKTNESILIADEAVFQKAFHTPYKKIVLSASLYPIGSWLEKKIGFAGTLGAGGSIAASALHFALVLGSREIYFAGIDFSYPKKNTHVRGSLFEENAHVNAKKNFSSELQNVVSLFSLPLQKEKNYDGKEILTDEKLKMFAWYFESVIASNSCVNFFSLTNESLAIPNVKKISLTDFLKNKILENEKKMFLLECEKKYKNVFSEKVSSAIAELKNEFNFLLENVQSGEKICEHLILKNEIANDALSKIDNAILKSDAKEIAALMFPNKKTLDKEFTKAEKKFTKPLSEHQKNSLQSKIIYEHIEKAILETRKFLV